MDNEATEQDLDQPAFDDLEETWSDPYSNAYILSCELTSNDKRLDDTIIKLLGVLKFGQGGPLGESHAVNVRTNLKILLISLLRVWRQDPTAFVAVNRSRNKYRSNPWKLTYKLVEIIDAFRDLGFLEFRGGHHPKRDDPSRPRISRIRPTSAFCEQYLRGLKELTLRADRSVPLVVLKDEEKNYETVSLYGETLDWNQRLLKYLDLLEGAKISVPTDVVASNKGVLFDQISARRVFNNSSFRLGGRVYGSWWQRISEEDRAKVTIDGKSTVELDYEAQHLNHLYARKGQSVYDHTKGKDPYNLPNFPRAIVKAFIRTAINAVSREKAFQALRKEFRDDKLLCRYFASQQAFDTICDAVLEAHPMLEEFLYSGEGLKVQFEDSEICMFVIDHFTEKGIPVLSIHDSFIVPRGQEDELREVMTKAYETQGDPLEASVPHITG